MADHGHDHPDDGEVHVHVHSTKFYASVLGTLLFLTFLTVAVSYVDIDGILALGREVQGVGAWNLGVAVIIATIKATLVVLFFMHLKEDARFNGLVFVGALLFIGVFLAYTMNDTATRGTTGDRYNGVHIDPDTGERALDVPEVHGEVLEPGTTAAREHAESEAAGEGEAGGAEGETGGAEAEPEPEAAGAEGDGEPILGEEPGVIEPLEGLPEEASEEGVEPEPAPAPEAVEEPAAAPPPEPAAPEGE